MRLLSILARICLMAALFALIFGAVVMTLSCAAFAILPIGYWIWARGRWRGSEDSHGTSRWADLLDLVAHSMFGRWGIVLGRASYVPCPPRRFAWSYVFSRRLDAQAAVRMFVAAMRRRRDHSLVILREFTMLAAFAGTGRGKGVSLVLPNAWAYPSSLVTLDVKGEIFEHTASSRRRDLGQRVVALDPFGLTGEPSASLNPLDFLQPNALDFIDECRALATALVLVKGTEPDPHWNESAINILKCVIAWVASCEPDPKLRTMATVRKIVRSRERLAKAIEAMREVQGFHGIIRELSRDLANFTGDELASVLTTVSRQTEWCDSPAVAAVMGPSDFDPHDLRSGKLSIYLAVPPDKLESLSGMLRMWVHTLLTVPTRGKPDDRVKILYLLDEIGNCGRLPSLEQAITVKRGYGVRVFCVFQSIAQVHALFREGAETFLDYIDTQIYFGVNSIQSAKMISERAGDRSITIESYNETQQTSRPRSYGGADSGSESSGASLTRSGHGRALIRPDEVIRMNADQAIVYHRNAPPIPIRLIRWFEDPAFKQRRFRPPSRGSFGDFLFAAAFLGCSCLLAWYAWVMSSHPLMPGSFPVYSIPSADFPASPRSPASFREYPFGPGHYPTFPQR